MLKICITIPEKLLKAMEKERKQTSLSRSAFVCKAIHCFLGLDKKIDQELEDKYGKIYEALNKGNITLAFELCGLDKGV